MCTVHIHINEEAIRKHYPALSTKEFIPQWLQRQVDITNHNDAGRKIAISILSSCGILATTLKG